MLQTYVFSMYLEIIRVLKGVKLNINFMVSEAKGLTPGTADLKILC